MSAVDAHIRLEQKALHISMWGGVFFVLLELAVAVITNSQAVLMDSAYDAAELITIVISLKLVPLLYKPINEKRPFGYSQVETWFIVIKGFMLMAVTVGLVVNNIQIMLLGGRDVDFGTIALFECFAALIGVVISTWLNRINRKIESPMIAVEVSSWRIDAVASIGMTVAFLVPMLIKSDLISALVPYLDQIVAIVLTIFILPGPVRLIISGMRDLLLIAPEAEVVDQIKEISREVLERDGFSLQFRDSTYEVSRMGRRLWVAIYMTPKSDMISIERWSKIQQEIEDALKEEFNDVYVELLPSID